MTRRKTATVIGGGPAGLMAAEVLASAGIAVTVYDQMPSLGRKLLMAGRGGLNLTHSEPLPRFLERYGAARPRVEKMIERFPPQALRAWADGLGQDTFEGSSGRIFPKAMKASPLLRTWLRRLGDLGVVFKSRHRWIGWNAEGALLIEPNGGEAIAIDPGVTILALGGASWPRLGSDGAWTIALGEAGVGIEPLAASNAGVRIAWSDVFRQRFEGAAVKRLAINCDGGTEFGEAVVTRTGLEGGVVYASGPRIRAALARDGVARLSLDVRPAFSLEELGRKLALPRHKQSTATFLRKAVGLPPVSIGLAREGTGGPLPNDASELAHLLKAIPLVVTGTGDLTRAISTAGGIRFDALDESLMLKVRPGVFAAGEMLDWDAPTGGYLLQATFATAMAAAEGAHDWLEQEISA